MGNIQKKLIQEISETIEKLTVQAKELHKNTKEYYNEGRAELLLIAAEDAKMAIIPYQPNNE